MFIRISRELYDAHRDFFQSLATAIDFRYNDTTEVSVLGWADEALTGLRDVVATKPDVRGAKTKDYRVARKSRSNLQ